MATPGKGLDGILNITHHKLEETAPVPDEELGPNLAGEYLAAGHFRGRNMPCLMLYFNAAERKQHGKKKRQFQFVHLESDDGDSGFADDGKSFSVVFAGPEARYRVTVRGRNLEKLYDLIAFHRLAWIRSIDSDRDFKGADDAQVITGIAVEAIEAE